MYKNHFVLIKFQVIEYKLEISHSAALTTPMNFVLIQSLLWYTDAVYTVPLLASGTLYHLGPIHLWHSAGTIHLK